MALYLRFSTSIQEDIERGTSVHCTSLDRSHIATEQEVEECFNIENVIYVENHEILGTQYVQVLDGLCAFELDADNLEDAIEEAKTLERDGYSSESCPDWHILEADYCGDCPEGDLIDNITLLYSNK